MVLAEQFRGACRTRSATSPARWPRSSGSTVTQFGILAPVIPIAFVVTALRQPRYALLTGTAVLITCFFAASYENADISRYYLGPALMAWTWLAILGGLLVDAAGVDTGGFVRQRPTVAHRRDRSSSRSCSSRPRCWPRATPTPRST